MFNANTNGLNAPCTTALMSTPSTNRITQKNTISTIIGVSDRKDSCTASGTLAGIRITAP